VVQGVLNDRIVDAQNRRVPGLVPIHTEVDADGPAAGRGDLLRPFIGEVDPTPPDGCSCVDSVILVGEGGPCPAARHRHGDKGDPPDLLE